MRGDGIQQRIVTGAFKAELVIDGLFRTDDSAQWQAQFLHDRCQFVACKRRLQIFDNDRRDALARMISSVPRELLQPGLWRIVTVTYPNTLNASAIKNICQMRLAAMNVIWNLRLAEKIATSDSST